MKPDYKTVLVEWEDITGNTEPWLTIEDALDLEPAYMTTLGWLLLEKDEYIILSSTLGSKKEASDINCIPRAAIKNLEEMIFENDENNIDIPDI